MKNKALRWILALPIGMIAGGGVGLIIALPFFAPSLFMSPESSVAITSKSIGEMVEFFTYGLVAVMAGTQCAPVYHPAVSVVIAFVVSIPGHHPARFYVATAVGAVLSVIWVSISHAYIERLNKGKNISG